MFFNSVVKVKTAVVVDTLCQIYVLWIYICLILSLCKQSLDALINI